MDERAEIWKQQTNEPNEAYARFLIYRNLGVVRSIDKAYQQSLGIDIAKRNKAQRANGQWTGDSTTFNWVERASAWDISVLTEVGQQVVVKYINALNLSFMRIIEALQGGKVKPRTWGSVIESITILGGFIPQETVATIRQNNAVDTVPAIGANTTSTERTDKAV